MGRHNDKPIKDVLQTFLARNEKVAAGIHSVRLTEIWQQEMGPVISNYTKRVQLREGVLKITVTSAPLRRELLMGKEKIREVLNQALGQPLIQEVVVL